MYVLINIHKVDTDSKAHSQTASKPDSDSSSSLKLDEVIYGMKSFINQVSSVEGAEFPW